MHALYTPGCTGPVHTRMQALHTPECPGAQDLCTPSAPLPSAHVGARRLQTWTDGHIAATTHVLHTCKPDASHVQATCYKRAGHVLHTCKPRASAIFTRTSTRRLNAGACPGDGVHAIYTPGRTSSTQRTQGVEGPCLAKDAGRIGALCVRAYRAPASFVRQGPSTP